MLKRNISVEAGLVNDAVGTVTGFHTQKVDTGLKIVAINVLFSDNEQTVKIERQSSTFEVSTLIYYTRKQFPLILAFAITTQESGSQFKDSDSGCWTAVFWHWNGIRCLISRNIVGRTTSSCSCQRKDYSKQECSSRVCTATGSSYPSTIVFLINKKKRRNAKPSTGAQCTHT